jgi:hypothetical protein
MEVVAASDEADVLEGLTAEELALLEGNTLDEKRRSWRRRYWEDRDSSSAPAPAPAPTSPAPAPTAPAPAPVASPSPTSTAPAPSAPAPLATAPAPSGAYPPGVKVTSKPTDRVGSPPGYLSTIQFAELGTQAMRITDASTMGSGDRRHAYAKRQPWNADGSRLLLLKGSPARLLDGRTFKYLGTVSAPGDAIWSNKDPNILFGVSGNAFLKYNVATKSRVFSRSFDGYSRIRIGGGEGNVSDDDRYVALVGERSGGVDVIVYDISQNAIVVTKKFDGFSGPYGDLDSAGVSPSGRYVLVGITNPNKNYDLYDLKTMSYLRRLVSGQLSHGDMGYSAEGDEVLVTSADGQSALKSIRLSDGRKRVELSSEHMAWNQHTTCRNIARPGWCYVSTFYHGSKTDAYMYKQIFALKLDGSGTVQRFAPGTFANSPASKAYEREAQAVPNRDGSLVLWASDWLDASSDATIHTYVAGVRVPN